MVIFKQRMMPVNVYFDLGHFLCDSGKMKKALQQRTIETRARLMAVARELVSAGGYQALRIEELVQRAGVAKGTFFAHFADKDTLMDQLIGERINLFLDRLDALPAPRDVQQLADGMLPLLEFMAAERYVFDVILRRSGAAAIEEIGPIAMTFGRLGQTVGKWLPCGWFRTDVAPEILIEGFEALSMQVVALRFCALNNTLPLRERYLAYLRAWLLPSS